MRVVSVLLIALTISVCYPPRPADAFIPDIIAAIVIAVCEAVLDAVLFPQLKEKAEGSLEAAAKTYLFEAMIIDQTKNQYDLEKKLYKLDHLPLDADKRIFTPLELDDFYGKLYRSDGRNWIEDWDEAGFVEIYPGYRKVSPGDGVVLFSEKYAERVRDLTENFAPSLLRGNHEAALDITDQSYPTSVPRAMQRADILMRAGEHTKGGYRELIQAANQILTMSNQQIAQARIDVLRQTDGSSRFALNEIQEKTDRQAAFEQAVRSWNPPTLGAGY
jgi:hypothetical protein